MSEHASPTPDATADGLTRRRFFTGLGVAATATVVGGYGLTVWDRNGSSVARPRGALRSGALGPGAPGHTLVVLELGGGNDGLNTVVPHADGTYRSLRPQLAVTDPLDLDGHVGLNPRLTRLADRYRAGHVAIVEGVGYPDPDLSHFASLATWWSADTGGSGTAGWLGRYLDGTVGFDDPLAGVSIGPTPSPAMLGEQSFATSIADATGLQPRLPQWVDRPDDLLGAWAGFAPASADPAALMGRVEEAIRLTGNARRDLGGALSDARTAARPEPATPGSRATGATGAGGRQGGRSRGAITDSLALAAALVLSKSPPRVIYVSGLGDFDTHQGEAQRHPLLMSQLDAGIDQLFTTLDAAKASDRVVLMTVSEFGRRPTENGSGTDHGTAAPHFVIGTAVKGGRYGQPPDLRKLDAHGNLVHTVDFRSLYATALHGWLGVDPTAVLGTSHEALALFA